MQNNWQTQTNNNKNDNSNPVVLHNTQMYHHTKTGYKRPSSSEDTVQTKPGHMDRQIHRYIVVPIPPQISVTGGIKKKKKKNDWHKENLCLPHASGLSRGWEWCGPQCGSLMCSQLPTRLSPHWSGCPAWSLKQRSDVSHPFALVSEYVAHFPHYLATLHWMPCADPEWILCQIHKEKTQPLPALIHYM